jgi:hypothetical protein
LNIGNKEQNKARQTEGRIEINKKREERTVEGKSVY